MSDPQGSALPMVMILIGCVVVVVGLGMLWWRHGGRNRAYVAVGLEPGQVPGVVDLVVRNTGRSLARRVRITFAPSAHTTLYANSGSGVPVMISEGIPALPPGDHRRVPFENLATLARTPGAPRRYDVTVRHTSTRHVTSTLLVTLDLGVLLTAIPAPGPSLDRHQPAG